jgi:hypothetical protein
MKIVLLLSGSPRFYRGFDTFTDSLEGHNVDWYCHFWEENLPPDKLGYENFVLVADRWRIVDRAWSIDKISSNLPKGNKLVDFETYDATKIAYPTISGPQVHHTNFPSIWKMHSGWKMVDSLRQRQTVGYDLVIRARPDLYLPKPLDFTAVNNLVNQSPNSVLVSQNGQHGYVYTTNDIIAISRPEAMTKYTDLINHSLEYNKRGIMFHPETLLAYHMIENGLSNTPVLNVNARHQTINLPNGDVTVDFGRWK